MSVEPFTDTDLDEAPSGTERGRVSLRTLIWIRWVAVAGQAVTLLIVHLALGFTLPLEIALGVVATSALINLANQLQRTGSLRLGDRDAMMYLAYDVVQLGALLYLTGGLQNPFALLVLAPVTVGATILSRRSVMLLSGLTVGVTTVLAIWHLPLPWDEDQIEFPLLYVSAVWLALTLSTIFISAYTWSITEEGRRISDAYAATQLALAREQRISAVGALAAAAAHELGSPLGTIAVIAKELAHDLPADGPLAEDARLLLSETARCRTILQELAQKREADGGAPYDRLPLSALVEAAGDPYRVPHTLLTQKIEGNPGDQPLVARSPEIMHGLGNLVQNAVQFAIAEVVVRTEWDPHWVTVTVVDDGPGFPTQVLSRLGEPYLSGRDEDAEHMGLGIFIAETLLRRTGAKLHYTNGTEGGAVVRVRWPRRALATVAGQAGSVV
jgi:two-component system sensor histidine kinase RegB